MRSLLTAWFVPRQAGWILARRLPEFTTFGKHPLRISGQNVEGLLNNPRRFACKVAAALAISARRVQDVGCPVREALSLLVRHRDALWDLLETTTELTPRLFKLKKGR